MRAGNREASLRDGCLGRDLNNEKLRAGESGAWQGEMVGKSVLSRTWAKAGKRPSGGAKTRVPGAQREAWEQLEESLQRKGRVAGPDSGRSADCTQERRM